MMKGSWNVLVLLALTTQFQRMIGNRRVDMADKIEQCKKCKRNCPTYIVQVKLKKGRIPFEECMDFMPIQTNADRIRSMTDEELAIFFDSGISDISINFHCEECNNRLNCDVCYLEWLQSEAE
jgi:hypothetical protein